MATKLPSGNWRTQVLVSKQPRKFKSFIGKTAREADAKAEQWKVANRRGVSRDSFQSAAEDFLSTLSGILSPSTLRSYRSMLSSLPSRFVRLPLSDITSNDLYAVYKLRRAPKTVRNVHGFISSVFSFRDIRMPKVTLPEKRKADFFVPSEKEVKQLFLLSKDTALEVPIALAARGMRRGEICAVTSDDLNGDILHINKGIVYTGNGLAVKSPKTLASDRYVRIPKEIAAKIEQEGCATSYTPDSLTRAFKRFLVSNGLRVFRLHDLRHAFVSIAHANGIPDQYIMAMGGWSTPYTMQNVYRHSLDSSLKKYSDKMESILD